MEETKHVNQEPKKVFELAKELEIDTIALLDKIKQSGVDVKNHMSELGSEEIATVKKFLDKEKKFTSKAPRKTTAAKEEVVEKKVAPAGASSATVIRRRAKAETPKKEVEEKVDNISETRASEAVAHEPVAQHVSEAKEEIKAQTIAEPKAEVKKTEPKKTETVKTEESLPRSAAPVAETKVSEEEIKVQPKADVESQVKETTSVEAETPVVAPERIERPTVQVNVTPAQPSVTITSASPQAPLQISRQQFNNKPFGTLSGSMGGLREVRVSPVQPVSNAPKESTINTSVNSSGRTQIVLRRREEGSGPSSGGYQGERRPFVERRPRPDGQGPSGFGGPRQFTPRPQRPALGVGSVPPPLLTLPTESRFDRDRKEKTSAELLEEELNRKKKAAAGKGEKDGTVPDVKIDDYKKKELFFMPKKKKIPVNKEMRKTEITTPKASKRIVKVDETITVGALADELKVKSKEVIKKLMGMGMMATINQSIDFDTATLIATEFGYEVQNASFKEDEILNDVATSADGVDASEVDENAKPRPPVVTVMGHVDHGKTSLLDAIRKAKVAEGEAGGITQHIGAYSVKIHDKPITFLDTPGHEAFTLMRARGANSTDVVILVVAADDGVMPQTKEAYNHAKAAGVPIVVAINKIDKPNANVEKVKQGLVELGLVPEEWGGDTMFIECSAMKKIGIDKILEAVLLQAEVLDLKANYDRRAEGVIIEAKLEKGKGPVATVLIQKGTLRVGDFIVSGSTCGKVRSMVNYEGVQVKEVTPSYAVEIQGLDEVCNAGDKLHSVESLSDARSVVEHRQLKQEVVDQKKSSKMTLEEFFKKTEEGTTNKELPIVLKTDVQGSIEAIRNVIEKVGNENVKARIIHSGVGGITENDVLLASASNAVILGFNVRPETKAIALAEREATEVKTYQIIYELADDIKKALEGLLAPKKQEKYIGRAEIRALINVPKVGLIAGSYVVDGKIQRGAKMRLIREGKIILNDLKILSLKRFKDDAREVAQGYECGIGIEGFSDIKESDLIEAYIIEDVKVFL